jgi:two-component system, chemotaxis family, response regulator Rcp1
MSPLRTGSPVFILLVEDNPGDARLVQEVVRESKLLNELVVVPDGLAAMDLLRRRGKYAGAPQPHLILLDLNLPKMDGRAVLREVKGDPLLRRIPVVVLTSSQYEEDVAKAYDLHANCYVRKPVDFPQFQKVVQEIEQFWFSIVELPTPVGPQEAHG